MAEKIINNPSLLPDDLAFELSGNTITAISGHPIAGSGGGTVSDLVYYPVFDNSNGNVTFHLGTSAHGPEPGGAWHISGPQGDKGDKGDTGLQGETGPQGDKGDKGDNGVSPTVSTSLIEGGNRVTFTYGAGQSESITVLNGIPGAEGASGYSPEITIEPATSVSYPNGGTKVTITDLEHQAGQEFYVWNGNDGQGATVNLLEGTGIKIEKVGQDYTIGVSGDYASTSDVESASANALSEAESWVVTEGYLKTVPDSYATKTYVETASANAYNKAVAEIPTDYITKDADDLTYYYKKTETSSTSEISNALTEKVNLPTSQQSGQLVYNATTNVWEAASTPSIPDITANNGLSANGHTVGISTNNIDANKQYAWTTTGWQLVSVPPIPDITAHNGLSANGHTIGIDDTNIVANTQYAWTTSGWKQVSIPDSYATKLYVNDASANAYSEAVALIPDVIGFIKKDVDDLTYYYKKTETSSTSELSTEFANKVNKPDTSLTDKYLVLRTDTNGAVSGWCDYNDKIYSKSESDLRYMQKNTDSTLSGNGTTNNLLGINTTNMAANKQYAFTTNGWEEVDVPSTSDYLPLSGGTVSGQLVVSGGSEFDQQFLKITGENVNGYARLGLGQYGALALKTDDSNSHTTQINVSPNTTNDQLVQVQHNGNTIGYLIPAIVEQAGWTPSTDDKILHIVLES